MAEPSIISGSAYDFQRDLGRYWRHLRRQGALNVTGQGWIYKNAFKTLLAAMNVAADATPDESAQPRLWFMRRLLTQLGEIQDMNNALVPAAEPTLFILPLVARIRRCFDAWHDVGVWHEVYRISSTLEYDPRFATPPELAGAHSALSQVIARLGATQPDAWIPTEKLIEELKRSAYDWLFPRNYRGRKLRGGTVYYQTPYYHGNNPYAITFTNVPSESKGWDAIERVAVHLMLNGPLSWMGVLDLTHGTARPDERSAPIAWRLTPTGLWLLGLGPEPSLPQGGGRIVTQPNFTLLAIDPVDDAALMELDQFADMAGGDRAVSYTLTRQSTYRAQRAGWDVARILSFLERHHGGPIPPNVRRTLEEWDALHRRITVRRGVRVLQYADDEALAGARDALGSAALTPFAPGFARLAMAGREAVRVLEDAGWEPLTTPAAKNDALGAAGVDDTGRVTFRHVVPSVHALGAVAPLAEGAPYPTQMTAARVQASIAAGLSLEDILRQLEVVLGGKLPAKLETSVRAWSGFFGTASLKAVTVLELADHAALNHLLADRELAGTLAAVEGSERPLALVRAEDVDAVIAALRERGIALRVE